MRKAFGGILFLLLGLTVNLAFTNCSEVSFDEASQASSSGLCTAGEPCHIPCEGEGCSTGGDLSNLKTYEEQVPFKINKVDILFIVDNSQSMKAELINLSSKFNALASSLGNKDWQACLITTDYENEKGAPRQWINGSYVLSPQTAGFQQVFEDSFNSIVPEQAYANFEQGIRSARASLELGMTSDAQGCWRADAGKALVFISDEDELGDGWILGDKSALQPTADNWPQSLVEMHKTTFNGLPLSAHAIVIAPGDEACLLQQRNELGTYEESMGYPAHRYAEVSSLTQGEVISICSADYSHPLSKIAKSIIYSLDSIKLDCEIAAKVASLEIVSQTSVVRSYQVEDNRVKFSPALAGGEKVTIKYSCY